MPTPNLKNLSADDLAAELARREQEAQAEQAERDAAWKEEQANRARPILESWQAREAELVAAEREAYAAFTDAVLADPVVRAFIDYRWHRYRRMGVRTEAQNAAHVLGEPQTAERVTDLASYSPTLLEDIVNIADGEAQRLAAEDSAAVMDQLRRPEGS